MTNYTLGVYQIGLSLLDFAIFAIFENVTTHLIIISKSTTQCNYPLFSKIYLFLREKLKIFTHIIWKCQDTKDIWLWPLSTKVNTPCDDKMRWSNQDYWSWILDWGLPEELEKVVVIAADLGGQKQIVILESVNRSWQY